MGWKILDGTGWKNIGWDGMRMGCGWDGKILDGTGYGLDVNWTENIGRDEDVDVDVDVMGCDVM